MSLRRLKDLLGLRGRQTGSSALARLAAALGLDGHRCATPGHQRTAFTIALVALAAKMAKADGVAIAAEMEAFEQWFHVPDDQREVVRGVFGMAKRDVAGFEQYASQISDMLAEDPEIKRDVFECLFHVASADGVLHGDEERFLKTVAGIFKLSDSVYAQVRRMFVADPDDPYAVLGLPHDITDEALKAAYRQLVKDNHSDRLAAHGVPREFQVVADRKLAAINAAYDAIVKERASHAAPASASAADTPIPDPAP